MSAEKCLDSDILLQQISVPADWQVVYHQFYDIHPDHPVSVANCPNGDMSELFKSTLWVARHEASGLMIDVGWAPEADLSGEFVVRLVLAGDYSSPRREVATREPDQAIAIVEQWMREDVDSLLRVID